MHHIALDLLEDGMPVIRRTSNNNSLNDIVWKDQHRTMATVISLTTELVFRQRFGRLVQLVVQRPDLLDWEYFEHLLQDPTSVRMNGKLLDVAEKSSDEMIGKVELDQALKHYSRSRRRRKSHLHNMICVLAFDALQDMRLDLFVQGLTQTPREMLKRFLNNLKPLAARDPLTHPTTIHLRGELINMVLHLLRQSGLLVLISTFEELLCDIVAEEVGHKGIGIRETLVEDLLTIFGGSSIDLLLDEAGSVLIARELDDVAEHILGGSQSRLAGGILDSPSAPTSLPPCRS